jgi:hypothetical protein
MIVSRSGRAVYPRSRIDTFNFKDRTKEEHVTKAEPIGFLNGNSKAVLVVAHPGHELLLHGWLELAQPHILILTDGTGREGTSRIGSTIQYVSSLGIRPGTLFGRYSDLEVYERILAQDFEFFNGLADEICEAIVAKEADYVVADSAEGYNSVHDLCQLLTNCAVLRAQRMSGRSIAAFEYPVMSGLISGVPDAVEGELRIVLDQPQFERKLNCAQKYYGPLIEEVAVALAGTADTSHLNYLEFTQRLAAMNQQAGLDLFRTECLQPVSAESDYRDLVEPHPYYESRGESRVDAGFYEEVIRYDDHMLPLADSIRRYASRISAAFA